MINFYEILCSINAFLNSKQKEKVASQFVIDSFGKISIIIHEIFRDDNYIDGNYGKICELYYLNGKWEIEWEKPNSKNGDYIDYIAHVMSGTVKEYFEFDIENYNWQP